jgi:hypothetical protein
MAQEKEGVIVFIERDDDGFYFKISDEYGIKWFLRPKNKESFVVEKYDIESFVGPEENQFKYADFGVNNLNELYLKFLQNPDKFIKKLFKLDKHVIKVKTE